VKVWPFISVKRKDVNIFDIRPVLLFSPGIYAPNKIRYVPLRAFRVFRQQIVIPSERRPDIAIPEIDIGQAYQIAPCVFVV
jgi:hypothetical protein